MLTREERHVLQGINLSAKQIIWGATGGAIESATPVVRETFLRQLGEWLGFQGEVFHAMSKLGLYPAYDLKTLLQSDVKLAQETLGAREA
ncbi:MAG: spore coat protein [Brockia lithotrophica]|nr:spore coat protein [Brockia lithotrophica]